jgi:CheY-like chemotaxis protein
MDVRMPAIDGIQATRHLLSTMDGPSRPVPAMWPAVARDQ